MKLDPVAIIAIIALSVGVAEAIILFFTIREMRISRRQSVKPFIIGGFKSGVIHSFPFDISNYGQGIALFIRCYLNDTKCLLGELDLILPQETKQIIVNFNKINIWRQKQEHTLIIIFEDIYGNRFKTEFTLENEAQTRFPRSISFVNFGELHDC